MRPEELARLHALCQRTREAQEWAAATREARDNLAASLVEAGYSQKHVAGVMGISRSRMVAIVGNVVAREQGEG